MNSNICQLSVNGALFILISEDKKDFKISSNFLKDFRLKPEA